jgi:hypothetical protein
MTQDEIIEMARQAGYFLYDLTETHGKKTVETDEDDEWAQLEAFAKLVAAKEREACAKECWKQMGLLPAQAWTVNPYEQCIDAIRARGQA